LAPSDRRELAKHARRRATAAARLGQAEADLVNAMRVALTNGASIRVVAEATSLSPSAVQRLLSSVLG
jgi:FAD/FMN-containing dehydrogenase